MTSNKEIWDVIYFGMWNDLKKAYGGDLDPNGFLGKLCEGYADAIVKALSDVETHQVQPGRMAPHISNCSFTKIASGRAIAGDLDGNAWEECTAAELVPGDVVTHIQVGRQWVKCKQQNGDESAGFRVTESWFNIVFGYVLLADGSTPASENALFSLDNPARLRVVPWDARPAAVKADPSKWNGTCARCGRGTYTGFTSTEHDGPCE